jgi:hybrid cluster-associated redox disulfide protein
MTVAALIIAVVALLCAYLAWHAGSVMRRELDKTNEGLSRLEGEMKAARAEQETRLAELKREASRQSGSLRFLPGMTIADAMQLDARVRQVLAEFQLGGCSNCAVSDVDTLEGACRSYGIDLDGLMVALNRLLDPSPDSEQAPAAGGSAKPIDVARMRVQM